MFSFLKSRVRSFGYAFEGIAYLFQSQINARIHLLAVAVLVVWGFYLELSHIEWATIWICIGVVLSLETVNTAIETLTDLVSPEHNLLAKKTKDLAAAAVLISVLCFAVVWAIIFLPKLF